MSAEKKWVALPKVELHCHLDGSLSPELIRRKLREDIPLSRLQVNPNCRDLAEYLDKFPLPVRCLQDEDGLREAGYDLLRSVSEENVRYIEVRFAPSLSAHGSFTEERVIQSLLEGLEKGKAAFGTEYNVIVCAMRGYPEEQNLSMLRWARGFLGKGVCGADLAGNEAAYPMADFRNLFDEVRKMGMPFTIHAGECGSAENIREAIRAGATRIGHGIAMRGMPELQSFCRERGIGIELCPTSNLQTKAVKGTEEYPLREYLDAGLFVTVNTDNRTVSGSTLSGELAMIQNIYGIRDEEVYLLMENAVKVSFAEDALKEKLSREIHSF